MAVKKAFAYIFLIMFSFQVLPVKELGKLLFSGQMTEEVHQSCDFEDDFSHEKIKKSTELYHAIALPETCAVLKYSNSKVSAAFYQAHQLPLSHVPDILTPPPNC